MLSKTGCHICYPLWNFRDPQKWTECAFKDLEDAVQQGCTTCSVLDEGIRQVLQSRNIVDDPSSFMLWGICQSPGLEGSKVCVVLKFQRFRAISLDFYTTEDSHAHEPWDRLTNTTHQQPYLTAQTRLDQTVTWLKQQIQQCAMDHKTCQQLLHYTKPLPSRILDLETGLENPLIRLVESTSSLKGLYMTLSHCWGGYRPTLTTKNTLAARVEGIPFLDLSRTFQDAVIVTRNLGIRYLWIDSLCIVQDDSEDWEREASRMADVFTNSYLTIAATSAKDSRYGCFLDLPVEFFKIIRNNIQGDSGPMKIFVRSTPEHNPGEQAHLELIGGQLPVNLILQSRAWAFQERMLSPRVVHYHKWDVFFECRTKLECQCGTRHFRYSTSGDVPVRPKIKLGRDSSKEKLCDVWEKVFKDYSMLLLTNMGDKLPAFSGIAKLFASNLEQENETLKVEYLAGLWRPLLPQSLLWYADHNNSGRGHQAPTSYQAPTWSWASINHPVESQSKGQPHHDFAIEDVWCRVPGKNPFGRVIDGRLRLRGLYLQYPVLDNERTYNICLRFPELGKHFRLYPNDIEGCMKLPKGQVMLWILVLVLVVQSPLQETVLVLEEVEMDSMSGIYIRVGMATTTNSVGDLLWRKDQTGKAFEII